MKPHILQTVADLRQERERLDDIIATLERYGAATQDEATPAPGPVESAPAPAKPTKQKPSAKASKPKATLTTQVRHAISKVGSKFKVGDLMEHLPGLDAQQVGSVCSKLRAEHELAKLGWGEYARTDRFGLGGNGTPSKTEEEYAKFRSQVAVPQPID